MRNRKKRIEVIIDIIKNNAVGSQEELVEMLAKKGHNVTQATLSRDLKMLRTTKISTDRGSYMYVLPDNDSMRVKFNPGLEEGAHINIAKGLVSVKMSGNMVVIKTRNGYASALAYDIDMGNHLEILGTIAGADTVFAVMRENVSRSETAQLFSSILSVNLHEYNL